MGKIRGNNPLFTTKLHFVENFIRMRAYKGYNVGYKCIDFIDIKARKMIVGESGRKCGLWKSRWEMRSKSYFCGLSTLNTCSLNAIMDTSKFKFSGHESFHCRSFWLKKGYEFVQNGNSFSEEAGIELGVGKNMVDSLRYWLRAFGIINKQNEPTFIATKHWKIHHEIRWNWRLPSHHHHGAPGNQRA